MKDLDNYINKEIKNVNDTLIVLGACFDSPGADKKFLREAMNEYYNDLECLYTLRFIYHNYKSSLKFVDKCKKYL